SSRRNRAALAHDVRGMPHGDNSRSRERSRRRRRSSERRLNFGRHMGRRYREVARNEPGYCRWALSIEQPQGELRQFADWLRRHQDRQRRSPSPFDDLFGESDFDGSAQDEDPEAHEAPFSDDSPWDPYLLPPERSMERIARQLHASITELAKQVGPHAEAQRLAELLDRLPRVRFAESLFRGSPHPESCPMCMEDFEAWEDENGAMAIVLTPCLHAFHRGCLAGVWWASDFATGWAKCPAPAAGGGQCGFRTDCPACRWPVTDLGDQKLEDLLAEGAGGEAASAHGSWEAGEVVVLDD
ncbi:unnamed protein product, partial [Effrenium voratum]